ncbi:UvrD-helicase domain-containing protein [Synechocystis sp. FACHB-383]|uniref:UvrD-helicase domain-containing protein n=1 Tax=Synechocystis sp. FACHB-383 TaxID=2692864 RepID=UPI0016896886|nr:UvrD-helicase domain-containing protein [Synechocystis sp. FACHB-383]MBD2654602.1 UvrD-helicase domain-containing protein [Synechocystis sp. FACHB-383]
MIFDGVYIENSTWLSILECPAFKNRLDKLVEIISEHYVNPSSIGKQIRHISGNQWKIRLNSHLRLAYEIRSNNQGYLLIIGRVLTHEEGNQLHQEKYIFPSIEEMMHIFDNEKFAENVEENSYIEEKQTPLYREWNLFHHQRLLENENSDLPWVLHNEQQKYCTLPGPVLLKGNAGSGKTTIAMYRLISSINQSFENPEKNRLYVTYTKQLSSHAKYLYEQICLNINVSQPIFLTIDELCFKVLNEFGDQKDRLSFNLNDKMNFEIFCKIPAFRGNNKCQIDTLWEEIRGIIKGHESIDVLNTNCLTLEEYLNIPYKQVFLNENERRHYYNAFQKYQKYLSSNGLWDELDLSQRAYQIIINNKKNNRYEEIIVDEVQDLTSFHIRLILELSSNYNGIFFAGDMHQAIHPSRFDWKKIKALIYLYINDLFKQKQSHEKFTPKLDEVNVNFRSPEPVVNFANHIIEWRNTHFLDNQKENSLKAINIGEPIYILEKFKNFEDSKSFNQKLSHKVMIIVWDDKAKLELSKHFNKGAIFTIHESKGLERDYVILWQFFNKSKKYWNYLSSDKQTNEKYIRYQYKYLINLLNVAITRPRKVLLIIDEYIPYNWQPIRLIHPVKGKLAQDKFKEIINIQSSNQDYINSAWELEEAELYEQAADIYLLANTPQYAQRCLGHLAKKRREYILAADFYSKSNLSSLIVDALECYGHHALINGNYLEAFDYYKAANISAERVIGKCHEIGNYRDAFIILMKSPDLIQKNSMLDFNYYLSDEKILASLTDLYSEIYNEIATKNNLNLNINLLAQYSQSRLFYLHKNHSELIDKTEYIIHNWNKYLILIKFLKEEFLSKYIIVNESMTDDKVQKIKSLTSYIDQIEKNVNAIKVLHKKFIKIQDCIKNVRIKNSYSSINAITLLDKSFCSIHKFTLTKVELFLNLNKSPVFNNVLKLILFIITLIENQRNKYSSILLFNQIIMFLGYESLSLNNFENNYLKIQYDFYQSSKTLENYLNQLLTSKLIDNISNIKAIETIKLLKKNISNIYLTDKYGLSFEKMQIINTLDLVYSDQQKDRFARTDKEINLKNKIYKEVDALFSNWNLYKNTNVKLITQLTKINTKNINLNLSEFIENTNDNSRLLNLNIFLDELLYICNSINFAEIEYLNNNYLDLNNIIESCKNINFF